MDNNEDNKEEIKQ